jgi:hypothetical protein
MSNPEPGGTTGDEFVEHYSNPGPHCVRDYVRYPGKPRRQERLKELNRQTYCRANENRDEHDSSCFADCREIKPANEA